MKDASVARSWAAVAIALIATGATTRAQELDEQEEQPQAVQNHFVLDESNFEIWVFGQMNRANPSRGNLDSLLMLSVADIERCCKLSEAQKKKLLLAGRGDIKHFTDRLAEARKVFELLRFDQQNINAIHQETVPLAATLRAGLFGPDSFFSKTVRSTLDPDQAVRFKRAAFEKDQFRHQAKIRLAISSLDNAIGFTAEQRQQFTDVVLKETRPSRTPAGQQELQVALAKISQIPDSRLRPIFDDARWRSLQQRLQQARAMERFLRANGLLEVSEPVVPIGD